MVDQMNSEGMEPDEAATLGSTTDFIVELIRAANGIDRLPASEKNRLLDRSVTVITELREQIGIPASRTRAVAIIELQVVAASFPSGRRTDEQVKAVLSMPRQ
jgi:hypothetical protein